MTDGEAPVPRATYRLQLNKDFRFDDGARLAPYLGRLGISHAYLSPILKARPGSTHGYDTVDHAEINPELGTIDDFRRMAAALRAVGVGIILDIVPNHMGIGGSDNPYWLDVLENGPGSRYAHWFDIDWQAPGLVGKVLVPFLGLPLGEAISDGVITLRQEHGKWAAWAHDSHKLPLAPETYELAAKVATGGGDLADLLSRQHWRLANASTASDEINYRRFFIISDLAGIRIEEDEVFEHVHRLSFALIAEGWVDGLRVDHIDGLYDPAAYCLKLRARSPRPIHIVVEKILAEDEKLPAAWGVDGTTGYEFATLVTPLLTDPAGEPVLTEFYRRFSGDTESPAEIEADCKCRVMDHELAAELEALARRLASLAASLRPAGDLTRYGLKRALRAFIAALPVYRLYLAPAGLPEADRAVLEAALAAARADNPDLEPRAFDLVGEVVTGRLAGAEALDLAQCIQQFTGPVMAKGLEDTALYRYNRLVALNDVGERPDRFNRPIAAFHDTNVERASSFPHSLLATSTHDSKRGEDARCRILSLSGHAAAWAAIVPEWMAMLQQQDVPAIDPDDAYAFFQNLLGAWTGTDIADRLVGAMQKSMREARLRTGWIRPNAEYEADVEAFIRTALRPGDNPFLASFRAFETMLGRDGALNGMIATTLKLTVPGVPDIYQGAELWEQSLVDPDNRRPVDFALRERLSATPKAPLAERLGHWRDGAAKQALIIRLLAVRRARPALFADGSYEPLATPGDRVCAFVRRHGDDVLVVAVQLFPWRGVEAVALPLPTPGIGRRWTDLLTGGAPAETAFADLPLLVCGNFGAAT